MTSVELIDRARVVREAWSWVGTTYHHAGRIKGVGVDCAMFLAGVYEACEYVEHIEFENYPADWHLHRSEERFIGWLERVGARIVEQPKLGDIGLFKYGRCYSHGSIVVEFGAVPLVLHSYRGIGVVPCRLNEHPLNGRPVQWWGLE